MKEEILSEITQLQEEIERLDKEYKIYSEHSEEDSEPIKYNIDKKKWKIEELLKPVKEELKEKENEKNNKIEEITKEAEERLERLEKEYKIYREHSEEDSAPIKYNIDKIKWELEKQIKEINEQYETEKSEMLNKIEETGIDLEEYELKEKEEVKSEEKTKQNKDIEPIKEDENKEKQIEENTSQIINPILDDKFVKNNGEKNVNIGEGKSKVLFTEEELNSFEKDKTDENIEIIDLNKEEKETSENSEAVRILYSAKTDKYIVTNINTKEPKVVSRKALEKLDKNLLAEKIGKDLNNVDTNILQLLLSYDKQYKTHKADEYIETLSTIGMNKKQRQNAMKESQIDIEYNLKGLFDKFYDETEEGLYEYKDRFSKEEKEELLDIANNAKIKGIATIKKGPKVTIMELLDKAAKKFKKNNLLKSKKVEKLSEGITDRETEETEQLYSDKVNGEYWKSISKREYKKAIKEVEKEKKFKARVKVSTEQMEKGLDVNDVIERMNQAAKEKTENTQEREEK